MRLKEVDFIARNFNFFNIDDLEVVGRVDITSNGNQLRFEYLSKQPLSSVCARHRQILTEVPHLSSKMEKANAGIKIYYFDNLIGTVDGYGHFYHTKACSLRVALGGLIVSSFYRNEKVRSYALDENTELISDAISNKSLTVELLSKVLLVKEGNNFVSLKLAREMFDAILVG